jgi:pimeloyl-ACP methyl ester carboxylesterase
MRTPLPLALLLAACSSAPSPGTTAGDPPAVSCDAAPASVVTFETDDGLTLSADFHPHGPRSPVAALFHMIPPSNDRSNYPEAFRQGLVDAGFTVLNVDRRGAGDSEGEPRDAYEGPDGQRDVAAARAFLEASGCAVDRLILVGASNGTTSLLDYTASDAPDPAALVFLSGGPYTENQTDLEGTAVPRLPAFFGWGEADGSAATWGEGHRADAGARWTFEIRQGGAHGTQLFELEGYAATLTAWMAAQVAQ